MEMCNEYVPFKAVHPGEILREELKERGISQKAFAEAIGMPASNLNDVIKGKRSMNARMAVAIENVLGIQSEMWMNLQARYDIDCERIRLRDENQATSSVNILQRSYI